MYILFSPSEGKKLGGDSLPLNKNELLFKELYHHRLPLMQAYNDLILDSSHETLIKLTGIKKEAEIQKYQNDLFSTATMPSIQRYDGVAYDYLDLNSLNQSEKDYLFTQTIIFSNLFGPLRGGDLIPTYKFKQGSTLNKIATEKIYKKEFSSSLDTLFKDELILDLRAGFYEKFYALDQDFISMKFLKGGKSVSHWAKAYRGKVLQTLSKIQPKTKEELLGIEYEGLKFIESVPYKKKGTMLIYEVL
ncbi:peroxide stress protein YaaA [Sulfurimonas sp. MAG313]|nr:peroxide stress protein YaaA [Sulfurimonas sp. MAG313]MDF1881451.1 peroxide stress protein YaaA [Sulfurimonas sp. MAG313]